jgi:hypothetical protein
MLRLKHLFVIVLALFITSAFAQDSTKIIYSVEHDTLVKQRFIDRYENVFMTKVPTRHMFKVGISQYYQARSYPLIDDRVFNNSSLHLGYEFKFLPSFSLALSGHFPYPEDKLKSSLGNTVIDAQLRWFMGMNRRIKQGKAANNFSGNYMAVYYNLPGTYDMSPKIGLKLGFQRRFFNRGFLDFAVAVEQQGFQYGSFYEWSVSTQASFGIAFGDWKGSKTGPLCDILLCDQQLSALWKIRLPELTLGYYLNRGRLGIAYERKFRTSPFSLNVQFDLGMNRAFDFMRNRKELNVDRYENLERRKMIMVHSSEFFPTLSVQPRYYFQQKRQKLTGKGGSGLSGVYAGIHSEYSYYIGKHSFSLFTRENLVIRKSLIKAGPLLGFQQRLFRHGYVDANASLNYQNQVLVPRNNLGVKISIGIGFAL